MANGSFDVVKCLSAAGYNVKKQRACERRQNGAAAAPPPPPPPPPHRPTYDEMMYRKYCPVTKAEEKWNPPLALIKKAECKFYQTPPPKK